MTQVPPSRRDQHLAGSGIELKSDDSQFDVPAWREEMQKASNNTRGPYDEVSVESNTPFVPGNAVYRFIPSNFRTFLAGAGTAGIDGNLFQVTSGTALADLGTFVVAKGQSANIDLTTFLIRVPPSLRLVVSGRMASGSAADLTASITWYEDI